MVSFTPGAAVELAGTDDADWSGCSCSSLLESSGLLRNHDAGGGNASCDGIIFLADWINDPGAATAVELADWINGAAKAAELAGIDDADDPGSATAVELAGNAGAVATSVVAMGRDFGWGSGSSGGVGVDGVICKALRVHCKALQGTSMPLTLMSDASARSGCGVDGVPASIR